MRVHGAEPVGGDPASVAVDPHGLGLVGGRVVDRGRELGGVHPGLGGGRVGPVGARLGAVGRRRRGGGGEADDRGGDRARERREPDAARARHPDHPTHRHGAECRYAMRGVRRLLSARRGRSRGREPNATSRRRGRATNAATRPIGPGQHPGREALGRAQAVTARRRSRSGSTSQRRPASISSALSGQRSGALVAVVLGVRALERHRAAVVADLADLGDLLGAEALLRAAPPARRACPRSAGPPAPASWIRVGATQATGVVGEVPLAGELHRGQPVALGDRAHPLEPLAAAPRPSRRGESAGGRARRTRRPAGTSSQNRPP